MKLGNLTTVVKLPELQGWQRKRTLFNSKHQGGLHLAFTSPPSLSDDIHPESQQSLTASVCNSLLETIHNRKEDSVQVSL